MFRQQLRIAVMGHSAFQLSFDRMSYAAIYNRYGIIIDAATTLITGAVNSDKTAEDVQEIIDAAYDLAAEHFNGIDLPWVVNADELKFYEVLCLGVRQHLEAYADFVGRKYSKPTVEQPAAVEQVEQEQQQGIVKRVVTSHKVNGLNDALSIHVMDDPGPGNANHIYWIEFPVGIGPPGCVIIDFQNGPVKEAGVNGISNEALLAIVADRLLGFQAGAYACRENAIALTKIQEAMHWLHHRTNERLQRGVEGTMAK